MNKLLRKVVVGLRKLPLLIESRFDAEFLAPDVPMSQIVSHECWQKFLYEIGNKPGMRVLEIGSREVTGVSSARVGFAKAEYVGFDYYPGTNDDIVGTHTNWLPISRRIRSSILFTQAPVLSIRDALDSFDRDFQSAQGGRMGIRGNSFLSFIT